MKAAPFEYCRPADLDSACAILADREDARLIAGGQTLVPMMAMRLVRPALLVDIARVPDLSYVRDEGDLLVVGATTRQAVVEHDPLIRGKAPLLRAAMPWVGHAATRALGTIGGSVANADPAAEIALVTVTLDASLTYQAGSMMDEIPAADFFIDLMTTALPAAGCLTAVRFPVWREPRLGVAFHEVSARRSDFAFVSAAAQIALNEEGKCERLAIGIGAAAATPLRLDAAAQALVGTVISEAAAREAVMSSLSGLECLSDLHASAEYRRRVAANLAVRAILDACRMAEAWN